MDGKSIEIVRDVFQAIVQLHGRAFCVMLPPPLLKALCSIEVGKKRGGGGGGGAKELHG